MLLARLQVHGLRDVDCMWSLGYSIMALTEWRVECLWFLGYGAPGAQTAEVEGHILLLAEVRFRVHEELPPF